MAALAKEVFKSKPFTFLVGEARTPFTLHTDAVSKQSHALDVLVNGSMAEAQSGTAVMEDIFEDTFTRFCQFVYGGDYETPEYMLEPGSEPSCSANSDTSLASDKRGVDGATKEEILEYITTVDSVPVDPLSDWPLGSRSAAKAKKISKSRMLKKSFDSKSFEIEAPIAEFQYRCVTRSNEWPTENYTPVLLGHAQLYVFAEKWGIETLKTLSLCKLHRTLVPFKLYECRRKDIVELARYAYSEDNTPDTPNAIDSLRELVIHYVTCVVESLNQAPEFKLLLEENGVFGRDLVSSMMERFE